MFACTRCPAVFPTAQKLARHGARKRPCDFVVGAAAGRADCPGCGRRYSRVDSMRRHAAQCPAAREDAEAVVLRQRFEIAQLRAVIRSREEIGADVTAGVVAAAPESVLPTSFYGGIEVRPEHFIDAFDGNVALGSYLDRCPEGVDVLVAAELVVSLAQAAHRDALNRNVYTRLNTAYVWDGAAWIEIPVDEAARLLCDGIVSSAASLLAGIERLLLPNDIIAAADELPDTYAAAGATVRARARSALLDHLATLAPEESLAAYVVPAEKRTR